MADLPQYPKVASGEPSTGPNVVLEQSPFFYDPKAGTNIHGTIGQQKGDYGPDAPPRPKVQRSVGLPRLEERAVWSSATDGRRRARGGLKGRI